MADIVAWSTGYDYEKQAWYRDWCYIRCNHPADMDCQCYGKEHEGESVFASLVKQ